MWLDNHLVGYQCSECKNYIVLDVSKQGKYCPCCGYQHDNKIKWLPDRDYRDRSRLFAASGSCYENIYVVKGKIINGITFVSEEFTATRDSQKFWDDLSEFANKKHKHIELRYEV